MLNLPKCNCNWGKYRCSESPSKKESNSAYPRRTDKSYIKLSEICLQSFMTLPIPLLLKIFVLSKESRSYWSQIACWSSTKKGEMWIERFPWNLNILLISSLLTQKCLQKFHPRGRELGRSVIMARMGPFAAFNKISPQKWENNIFYWLFSAEFEETVECWLLHLLSIMHRWGEYMGPTGPFDPRQGNVGKWREI